MARKGYMVCETTNLTGSVCYSLQHETKALENGVVVGKGDLVTGETSIYATKDAYDDGMFLVANPAWVYDRYKATDLNEEEFINPAKVPFRAYKLEKDMKFKVANIPDGVTLQKGDYVKYDAGVLAKDDAGANKFKVVAIEEYGFPYCIGSAGTKVATYGHAVGDVTKKYTIQVM